MRHVEFRRLLEDNIALRVEFDSERGRIIRFVAQLECQFDDDETWIAVVRYDTAHGYAHRDTMHPHQREEKTRMTMQDYNEAFTMAVNDIVGRRREYYRRYETWLKK
ncbi:MAG: hypothetical protein M5U11_01990 [Anaerolineales bacterium]|jgi:hypothetical protein|nr:hypothetical protein [Anaerolineales bacterium]GER78715.1 conserved hypothetical protein [Candidatus Denitrolinea symbiosum]MCZ2287520.1 hypothetical protein [Anaerolineales bacterium]MCZ7547911.1 hypothetical protein [Anaerolineales bacterium]MDX9937057.1 hypothetical protein [Anaerolineales bacterium]